MAIERTNTNLAKFCLSVIGTPYWFGTFGNKADRSLYNSKKAQYPSYYPPKSWTEASFVDDFGKRVTDCAGLLKWFLWSNNMTDKAPTYKSSEDYGATTFYNLCTSKGKISSLPSDKIGILVFNGNDTSKSHMGVIVDNNGTVVEAKGHAYGTITSKASSWGYWGKCHLIKYESTPQPTPVPTYVDIKLPVLSKGSTGGEVYTLQILLNELGCRDQNGNRLQYDMIFGDKTQYALMQYQKTRGLTVSGICDFETWNRILK